jgi:hypothetical protein
LAAQLSVRMVAGYSEHHDQDQREQNAPKQGHRLPQEQLGLGQQQLAPRWAPVLYGE